MSEFVKAANVSDLQEGEMKLLEIEQQLVLLFRQGDSFYCIDDVCTHDGGTLSDGEHCGFEVACPRHGAKFDIRNGKALTMPATQDTASHEVKIEDGQVMVRLNSN